MVTRGMSGCELMCRFPNTGGLHRTSSYAPPDTHSKPSHEHSKPTIDSVMCARNIESGCELMCSFPNTGGLHRTSMVTRGMSRCELMCRFSNTGGLHRTSSYAPPDTHILTNNPHGRSRTNSMMREGTTSVDHSFDQNSYDKSRSEISPHFQNNKKNQDTSRVAPPPWCHVYKSMSPSSQRTQVAALACMEKVHLKHSTRHKRQLDAIRKRRKQALISIDVQESNVACHRKFQCMSLDYIRNNVVVCDGGESPEDAIQNTSCTLKSIHYLRIRDGDLEVFDTPNASQSIRFIHTGESSPVFIRLPREQSLKIMDNGRVVCNAMRSCASTQRQSLSRGNENHVFIERDNKYCCVGAQPGRSEKGVKSGLYRLNHGFLSKEWDVLHKLLKRAEHAFDMYMDTEIIRHISCAKARVNFKTMEPSPSSLHQKPARYYNGLGFGINVYLRSHIDRDFTMSIVQAHIDNHDYTTDDKVICYFAFPRIGIAVALRPGDFLLFNPQEPHSISSRCRATDEIFCISSYLKTGVVSLNDNSNTVV